MSTKIYEAVRFKTEYLNTFLIQADELGAQKEVVRFKNSIKLEGNIDEKTFKLMYDVYLTSWINHKGQNGGSEGGLNIWIHDDGYTYVMQWGQMLGVDLFFADWVEDFRYWNNTDRPKEIKQKEWDFRSSKWNEVCLHGDYNKCRLVHFCIDYQSHVGFGFYDLFERLRKEVK